MKYKAIVMVPKLVEFENSGNDKNVGNHAWGLCNDFDSVVMPEESYGPRLLMVLPETKIPKEMPLVFDPPPMAA